MPRRSEVVRAATKDRSDAGVEELGRRRHRRVLGADVGGAGHGDGQHEVLRQPRRIEAEPVGRLGRLDPQARMHAPEGDGEFHTGPPGTAARHPTPAAPARPAPPRAARADLGPWKNGGMETFPHTPMPEQGLPRDEVMQRLITMKQDDQDWRGGRVFSLVYSAGDDVHELLSDALALYSAENGLNVLAFPSIGIMQHDIVRNTATLLGADDPAVGRGGGGLSHLRWHREPAPGRQDGTRRRTRAGASRDPASWRPRARTPPSPRRPTTSTSTWSACRSRPDFRVSADALADACTDEHDHGGGVRADLPPRGDRPHRRHRRRWPGTGASCATSTPAWAGSSSRSWPSSGGWTSPFDFRLPGVTSMSADVHKYGYAVEGRVGDPVPDARAGPQAALRDDRLVGGLLRLDRHGRDPAGGAGRRRLGGHDAHRPSRLSRAHPHGARRGARAAGGHRVHRRSRACAATRRPR